jgi:hypothetical protein
MEIAISASFSAKGDMDIDASQRNTKVSINTETFKCKR